MSSMRVRQASAQASRSSWASASVSCKLWVPGILAVKLRVARPVGGAPQFDVPAAFKDPFGNCLDKVGVMHTRPQAASGLLVVRISGR